MNVETRQKIEKRIVKMVIDDILKAGLVISVYDGDGDYFIKKSNNKQKILAEMFAMDEDIIHIHDPVTDKYMGMVYFVYGNDGYDVICDYSISLEPFLTNANQLSDEICQKLF